MRAKKEYERFVVRLVSVILRMIVRGANRGCQYVRPGPGLYLSVGTVCCPLGKIRYDGDDAYKYIS